MSIKTVTLEQLVAAFDNKSWQVALDAAGGADPAIGFAGMSWRVASNAPFTGIHNKHLDTLINEGTSTLNKAKRGQIYRRIFKYLSDKALLDFTYTGPGYNTATTNAHGPGISTDQPDAYWADAWVSH